MRAGALIKGDYAQAESVLREVLKTASYSDKPDLHDLADLLREQHRGSEARSYFDEALRVKEAPWQAHFGAIPSWWQTGLADMDSQDEAWQESIAKWNEAIGIAKTQGNTLYESFAIRGLGETWLDSGDLSRAEPLLKRSPALVDHIPGIPPYRLGLAPDSLATLYPLQGKTSLTEAWSSHGDTDRARDYSRQVTGIMQSHFADDSPAMVSALVNEAVVEQRAHRLENAATLYARAFNIVESVKPSGNVSQAVAKLYAGVLSRLHRGREAKQIVAKASSLHAKYIGPCEDGIESAEMFTPGRIELTLRAAPCHHPALCRGKQHSQVA